MAKNIPRPPLRLHLSELFRAMRQRYKVRHFLKAYQPEKTLDPHTVLIIPGFMASQMSTKPMRQLLNRLGYEALDWGLGRNYARLENIDEVERLITQLYERSNEKISLIGWSLGGIYARKIAHAQSDKIRKVFTLGSPYRHLDAPNYASWLFEVFRKLRGQGGVEAELLSVLPRPLPIPSVAFYSKSDGIVPWQACIDTEDTSDHENIEVNSSHFGLGVHEDVLRSIIERL